jgi:hypothetical protein
MLITPTVKAKADTASVSSSTSRSNQTYEIWRRWSDCLIFQETLETEYSRMARCKKRRLVAGKGVKKNGVYIHDQASSFESLPNGPDPSSIHINIHDHLPKLTKKGTIFRTSLTTVDQRHKELQALIEALFDPMAPTLLTELREDRIITDFFGFWRRDYDLARKLACTASSEPRSSFSGSVLSLYMSPKLGEDVPTSSPPTSPRMFKFPSRPSTASSTSSQASPLSPQSPADSFRRPQRESYVSTSSSESSSASSRDSKGSDHDVPIIISPSSVPFIFGHNPEHAPDGHSDAHPGLRPENTALGPPPKIGIDHLYSPSSRRSRTSSVDTCASDRRCQIFTSPPLLLTDSAKDAGDISGQDKDSHARQCRFPSFSLCKSIDARSSFL